MAPLGPLPPESTARVWVEYTALGQVHRLELRVRDLQTSVHAGQIFTQVANILKPGLHTSDSFRACRWAGLGLKVSLPVDVTPVAGTNATTPDQANKPNFLSWTGRDVAGRRVRVTFFNSMFPENVRYRIAPIPAGMELNMLNWLKDTTNNIATIGNSLPIWNNYVNVGVNAYFQRKQRRT